MRGPFAGQAGPLDKQTRENQAHGVLPGGLIMPRRKKGRGPARLSSRPHPCARGRGKTCVSVHLAGCCRSDPAQRRAFQRPPGSRCAVRSARNRQGCTPGEQPANPANFRQVRSPQPPPGKLSARERDAGGRGASGPRLSTAPRFRERCGGIGQGQVRSPRCRASWPRGKAGLGFACPSAKPRLRWAKPGWGCQVGFMKKGGRSPLHASRWPAVIRRDAADPCDELHRTVPTPSAHREQRQGRPRPRTAARQCQSLSWVIPPSSC